VQHFTTRCRDFGVVGWAGRVPLLDSLTLVQKVRQIVAETSEEVFETIAREQVDVLGEEGEDTAHQEGSYGFGGVILFERPGEVGEVPGDVARDSGGDAAGIEGERVD